MRLGKNTVTRVRAELVTDPRDNTLYRDWVNAETLDIPNCMVEPFPMAEKLNFEINADREYGQGAIRIYCPPTTDIVYTDRLIFMGDEYDILGHSGKWYDFSARQDHLAVIAQRREG